MMRPNELPKHKQDEIRAKRAATSGGGWGNTGDLKNVEFGLMDVIRTIFVLAWLATLVALLVALLFLS